ncbi:hypothetical protein ACOSP7_010564 [Xanthoceras sorbifolium]
MADGIPRILRWKFSKRPDKGAIIPFLTESEAVVQQLEPSAIELGKPYYEGLMVFDDLFSEGEDIPGSGERADNRDFLETILMLSVRTMRMLGGTFLVLTKMSMQDTLLHHQGIRTTHPILDEMTHMHQITRTHLVVLPYRRIENTCVYISN